MKRKGIRRSFPLVLVLGVLLLCTGLIGLTSVPDRFQYAFLPPAEKDTSLLLARVEKVRTALGDAVPALALHGQTCGEALSAGEASQNGVTVYAVGPNWNEVCPRRFLSGRPISGPEAENGAAVVVLDEKTAFAFFADRDPVGQTVKLGSKELTVVGVAAHSRGYGDRDAYAAWVPLGLASDWDLLVLSAPAKGGAAMLTTFRTAAEEAFGSGTLISLPKEKMRATVILRWTAVIFLVMLLVQAARWLGGFWRVQAARVGEERKRSYAGRLVPKTILYIAPAVLLTALAVGAGYLAALLVTDPARVFPEWVPESLGDFSKWTAWFWNLISESSLPVRLQTPEMASVRFFGGLIRWGALLSLLGAVLSTVRRKIRTRLSERT